MREQELADCLSRGALAERVVARGVRAKTIHVSRKTPELVPHPCGALVQPGRVIVVLAPRSFGQSDSRVRWLALEILGGGGHADVRLGELAKNEAKPIHALEPPVAEELAVERHREQRVTAVAAPTR